MSQADFGVIGLAVMGENLVLNMASKGFTVAAFNRTVQKVTDFKASRGSSNKILGADSLEEFVNSLA
jgi:6-phosphogluconate dehydrogenase